MLKVLIIEDESLAAEKLQNLLLKIDSNIEILEVLETVDHSVNWLNENTAPDLIFMDIQLDDGISFEILEAIEVKTPIIFTTAYDEYAIKAFKVNSIDYLLKPIREDELKNSIHKYEDLYSKGAQSTDKIDKLLEQFTKSYKSRFFVKIGLHYHTIGINDIVCFYIQERGTFIKTLVGKNFSLDYSLDQVQKMVDPEMFYRINRNYIININAISDIISYSSNRLKVMLKNFEHLDDLLVSRDRTADFKKMLDK